MAIVFFFHLRMDPTRDYGNACYPSKPVRPRVSSIKITERDPLEFLELEEIRGMALSDLFDLLRSVDHRFALAHHLVQAQFPERFPL